MEHHSQHGHTSIPSSVRFVRALQLAWSRKGIFFVFAVSIFVLTLAVLASADLLPEEQDAAVTVRTSPLVIDWEATGKVPVATGAGEAPVRIEIPSIGLAATVSNPKSRDIETLDSYLLSGAVRYPTSGLLGEDGNVVIFGHSSYLPVVSNRAYKAFNNIQKLTAGDKITVYSGDTAYVYAVETVVKASADSGKIPLDVSGQVLTLATCNSFGEKSDRFVVTAVLVDSRVL